MTDILHEEIFSSLNFRVQSCKSGGGGGGGGTYTTGGYSTYISRSMGACCRNFLRFLCNERASGFLGLDN